MMDAVQHFLLLISKIIEARKDKVNAEETYLNSNIFKIPFQIQKWCLYI